MSKEDVNHLLQLSVNSPAGLKKRSNNTRRSKKKESVTTPTKTKETKPEHKVYATVTPAPYDVQFAQDVVFKANPGPQTQYLAASEREVLYGGAAGGGKSYATLADPLRNLGNKDFSGLLVRHTTEELRELIQKSQELYPKAIPGIKWSERKSQWTTPQGGRLWMSYLDKDTDVMRYQGQAFNYVAFDELTQWPSSFAWDYMRSRLRSASPELGLYMRATTNPGGPGHAWVKKMFIDPASPNTPFWATNIETGEQLRYPKGHRKEDQPLFKRKFIPASLFDNPYLADSGDYEAMLLSLPEQQRKGCKRRCSFS